MKKSLPTIVYLLRFYFNSFGRVFLASSSKKLITLFSTPRKKVIKQHETEVLATAKKQQLQVGDNQIVTYEWGEANKTAMLFHGWESNAGSLGGFVQPMLESGYKVISFDAPAHGKSGGKAANLLYFKRAAKAVIKHFGIPEVVIGHSLGANSIIMTSFEEKIQFKKSILISPVNELMFVFQEINMLLKLPKPLFNKFLEEFGNKAGYSLEDFFFHNFGKESPLKDVLLMHDQDDRVTPFSHSQQMAEEWSAPKLIPINGSGHYKILWKEEVLQNSIDFIKN